MFFLLLIPGLLILDLLVWYASDSYLKRMQPLRNRRIARLTVAAFMLLQIAGYLVVIGGRWVGVRAVLPAPLLSILYLWHLVILPASALLFLLAGIVRAAGRFLARRAPQFEPQAGSSLPTRRQVLAAAAVTLPPLLAIGSTGISMTQWRSFRIRRLDIPLAGLPPDLDGLTIAQVSDVHVGRFTRAHMLPAIVEATNQLRPDLVLMTGDLIDFSLSDLPAGIDMVKRMDPGHGLFTVEGNHDLFDGRTEFEQRVLNAGIPLLLNDSRTVRIRGIDVQILGAKWGMIGNRGSMYEQHTATVLSRLVRDPGVFPILLAHHPHAFDLAIEAGVPLTLAGHTHGGQLMLTDHIGPGPLMFKYWSGLYRSGDSALVVSNGIGNWFPLRINAPAEIVHITLRRA